MEVLERRFLPSTTNSVHAASIAFFRDHPVFSWFGGTKEGMSDVAIYVYNLNNNGTTIVIGDKDVIPRWNPILVSIKDNLILFEKSGMFCDRWQTFVHDISNWSDDITKKEIEESKIVLPAGLNGPVKSCPIVIDDELVCGSSVETMYDWSSYIETYKIPYVQTNNLRFVYRSNPLHVPSKHAYQDPFSGKSCRSLGIIQPTLWRTGSVLHAFMRSSRGLGKIYYARGDVGFNAWDNAIPTNLDNPNSAVDVAYFNDRLFLVHNPDTLHRNPLVLSEIGMMQAKNGGMICTITDQILITENVDEKTPLISRELSYPYMIEYGGNLHIVYTYGRSKIEYVVVKV
jgi:predicted neuraminidase